MVKNFADETVLAGSEAKFRKLFEEPNLKGKNPVLKIKTDIKHGKQRQKLQSTIQKGFH